MTCFRMGKPMLFAAVEDAVGYEGPVWIATATMIRVLGGLARNRPWGPGTTTCPVGAGHRGIRA